jgi:dihydrofolate reductase
VTFWAEDPAGAMAAWADRGLAAVYVDGGLLVHQFLEADLVEDLTVTVVPTLLGDGTPLFHRRGSGGALQLDGFRSWPSGMVQLRYRAPGSV